VKDISDRVAAAAAVAGFRQRTSGESVELGWTDLETAIELVRADGWTIRTSQRGVARPSPSFTDREDAEEWMLAVFRRLAERERSPAPDAVADGWTVSEDGRTVTSGERSARFPFATDARRFTWSARAAD